MISPVAIIIIIVATLITVTLLLWNFLRKKTFGFSNTIALKGLVPNAIGTASINKTKDGKLTISVEAYLPVNIVGTPAYQAWLVNKFTGSRISLGRMEKHRAGEYKLNTIRAVDDSFGDVVVSEEDNPYDSSVENVILES